LFVISTAQKATHRTATIVDFAPFLRLSNIAELSRAIASRLDVGPSELHLYFMLHQLKVFSFGRGQGGASIDQLAYELNIIVSKLRNNHLEYLCLIIIGVHRVRIEQLKSYIHVVGLLDDQLTLLDGEVSILLQSVAEALNGITRTFVAPVTVDSGRHGKVLPLKSRSLDKDKRIKSFTESGGDAPVVNTAMLAFVANLLTFHKGVVCLSSEDQSAISRQHFGNASAMHTLFECVLSDVTSVGDLRIVDVYVSLYAAHSALVSGGENIVSSSAAHSPSAVFQLLSDVLSSRVELLVAVSSSGVTDADSVITSYYSQYSALSSLLVKAQFLLASNDGEQSVSHDSFRKLVTRSLAGITIHNDALVSLASKSPNLVRDAEDLSVMDICFGCDLPVISNSLLNMSILSVPLTVAIALLHELSRTDSSLVTPVLGLLVARYLQCDLYVTSRGAVRIQDICLSDVKESRVRDSDSWGIIVEIDKASSAEQLINAHIDQLTALGVADCGVDISRCIEILQALLRRSVLSAVFSGEEYAQIGLHILSTDLLKKTAFISDVVQSETSTRALSLDTLAKYAGLLASLQLHQMLFEFFALDISVAAHVFGQSSSSIYQSEQFVGILSSLPQHVVWVQMVSNCLLLTFHSFSKY
jgi:hypothetical protein